MTYSREPQCPWRVCPEAQHSGCYSAGEPSQGWNQLRPLAEDLLFLQLPL